MLDLPEETRGVALRLPTAVFNRLSREAHERSLREGRVFGVATVIREAVANTFSFSVAEDAALRGDRRKGRTKRLGRSVNTIRDGTAQRNTAGSDLPRREVRRRTRITLLASKES